MRIRFLVSIASATWSYAPGDDADFPDAEALAFVAGGTAVRADDVVETTMRDVGERAVAMSGRRGRRA